MLPDCMGSTNTRTPLCAPVCLLCTFICSPFRAGGGGLVVHICSVLNFRSFVGPGLGMKRDRLKKNTPQAPFKPLQHLWLVSRIFKQGRLRLKSSCQLWWALPSSLVLRVSGVSLFRKQRPASPVVSLLDKMRGKTDEEKEEEKKQEQEVLANSILNHQTNSIRQARMMFARTTKPECPNTSRKTMLVSANSTVSTVVLSLLSS